MPVQVSGWGRNLWAECKTTSSLNLNDVLTGEGNFSLLPVGLYRSYGDSALNDFGISISSLDRKDIEVSAENRTAHCGSGVTIGELEIASLEKGFFPYVVPGTQYVTIGGAIASDIHGKSHHLVGSFGNYVQTIKLRQSDNVLKNLAPIGDNSNSFWATVGGMGLTGFIESAVIKLKKIDSPFIRVKNIRVHDLSQMLRMLKEVENNYEYVVAWIDFSGKFNGRGVITVGNHTSSIKTSKVSSFFKSMEKMKKLIRVPNTKNLKVINRMTIRIFNSLWFYKPSTNGLVHIAQFMHPLDGIGNWNNLYGKTGFIQYQFVIPFENEDYLFEVLSKFAAIGAYSPMTVLKGMGDKSQGYLSFPMKGWTLAIDLPAYYEGLQELLDEIDSELISLGGRVYLTKDSRMKGQHLKVMYPNLDTWRSIRSEMDARNLWSSNQSKRLGIL